MTPEQAAAALAGPVSRLGGAFMTDPATREAARAHGLSAWAFYYAGRLGVLGAVEPEVAVATAVFLPFDRGVPAWQKGTAVLAAPVAATRYAEQCHRWGREHLGNFPGAERLATLARRVAGAVDPAGLPLFAGWRAMPEPVDPPARAALALQVLREHRGGVHGLAVLASGLLPLEAIVAGRRPADAEFLGWSPPYPDPEPLTARRDAAEALTTQLAAPPYAVLSAGQRDELVELVTAAGQHAA